MTALQPIRRNGCSILSSYQAAAHVAASCCCRRRRTQRAPKKGHWADKHDSPDCATCNYWRIARKIDGVGRLARVQLSKRLLTKFASIYLISLVLPEYAALTEVWESWSEYMNCLCVEGMRKSHHDMLQLPAYYIKGLTLHAPMNWWRTNLSRVIVESIARNKIYIALQLLCGSLPSPKAASTSSVIDTQISTNINSPYRLGGFADVGTNKAVNFDMATEANIWRQNQDCKKIMCTRPGQYTQIATRCASWMREYSAFLE